MFSVISLTLFIFVVLWFSSPLLGLARVAGYMFAFIFLFFSNILFPFQLVTSVDASGFDNSRDTAGGLEWLF